MNGHSSTDESNREVERLLQELGRERLALRVAQEEIGMVRDAVDLLADAATAHYRVTIADQATLVEERDAYIQALETRLAELTEELTLARAQVEEAIRRANRSMARRTWDAVRAPRRSKGPAVVEPRTGD